MAIQYYTYFFTKIVKLLINKLFCNLNFLHSVTFVFSTTWRNQGKLLSKNCKKTRVFQRNYKTCLL